MKHSMFKSVTLAMAVPGLALAAPAFAAPAPHSAAYAHSAVWADQNVEHGRKHKRQYQRQNQRQYQQSSNRYYGGGNYQQAYYGEPVYANTRVWRGNDNRYYCKRSNGTTGLLIGGVAGALLGREIAGNGDRTLGAILGAAGGALLGRAIDKGGSTCR